MTYLQNRKSACIVFIIVFGLLIGPFPSLSMAEKIRIKALAIPLADHYAAIVAYEKYRNAMVHADFQLQFLPGPHLVRAYFNSEPDADIAFNVCPMVMDMFAEKPNFRWVSQIHRDGNCLCINQVMAQKIQLPADKRNRKPDAQIARAFIQYKQDSDQPVICAIPSPLATHATILYKYLKDNKIQLVQRDNGTTPVITRIIKPTQSPNFLRKSAVRNRPAVFEQSLPWGEIAESGGFGTVGWYSKDVMQHPNGHVECIIIAKDDVIRDKRRALQEVIDYIHQAGRDIEAARQAGGEAMDAVIRMIQTHIPSHSSDAIRESLRPDLMVINYRHLGVDKDAKWSIRQIMDLAVEAGFLKCEIDIDALADESFSTNTQ